MNEHPDHNRSFILGILFLVLAFSFSHQAGKEKGNGSPASAIAWSPVQANDLRADVAPAPAPPVLYAGCIPSGEGVHRAGMDLDRRSAVVFSRQQEFLLHTPDPFRINPRKIPLPGNTDDPPPAS